MCFKPFGHLFRGRDLRTDFWICLPQNSFRSLFAGVTRVAYSVCPLQLYLRWLYRQTLKANSGVIKLPCTSSGGEREKKNRHIHKRCWRRFLQYLSLELFNALPHYVSSFLLGCCFCVRFPISLVIAWFYFVLFHFLVDLIVVWYRSWSQRIPAFFYLLNQSSSMCLFM